MKKQFSLLLASIISFGINSCKKDASLNKPDQLLSASESSNDYLLTPCNDSCSLLPLHWVGKYASFYYGEFEVADSTFILNGVAKVPAVSGYDYTNIHLDIPACKNLSGDSITLLASVKCPQSEGGGYPEQLTYRLTGSDGEAELTFEGDASSQIYTKLAVGSYGVTNAPELVRTFDVFTSVALQTKKNVLSAFINLAPIKKVSYLGAKIGTLQEITIGFKGVGSVDWVKLYNSKNQVIMQEQFNKKGKSSIVWYCY